MLNGPYVDSKEQLGGYYLIDVPDLDAALSWAARCPGASHGVVEVRPVWAMGLRRVGSPSAEAARVLTPAPPFVPYSQPALLAGRRNKLNAMSKLAGFVRHRSGGTAVC